MRIVGKKQQMHHRINPLPRQQNTLSSVLSPTVSDITIGTFTQKREQPPFYNIVSLKGIKLSCIIIYQYSKFPFSCVSLVESVSRESDEIRLFPSHQREREATRYSQVNNEKNHMRHHVKTRPLDRIDIVVLQKLNLTSLILEIEYLMYFRMWFALVCHFFDF